MNKRSLYIGEEQFPAQQRRTPLRSAPSSLVQSKNKKRNTDRVRGVYVVVFDDEVGDGAACDADESRHEVHVVHQAVVGGASAG